MAVQALQQSISGSFQGQTKEASSQAEMDSIVARLKDGARAFMQLTLGERIALARSMQAGYLKVAQRSVRAACEAKGNPLGTSLEGEEWVLGPWMVVRHLRLIRESLQSLERSGNTRVGKLSTTHDGRLAVRVFPASFIDAALFSRVTVDVHLQAGITAEQMDASRASFYKQPSHDGRVVLVLGAGNINAIVSMDALSKMFNEGKVCVIKMSPVNAYLGPYLEQAYAEAIKKGFLAVVYGGAAEGAYLVNHLGVDEVHITGSDQTYDLMVWGPPGPERERRLATNDPLLKKPVSAELGNVSPVIVLPGSFSASELAHQAEHVAGEFANNASFNCIAAAVLITPGGWAQRDAFLTGVEQTLTKAPTRVFWYPGAQQRWSSATQGRQGLRVVGSRTERNLPWAIASGLRADQDDRAFAAESFCPVLTETQVGGTDPIEFLDKAVTFANQKLWGTLAATLIVHPTLLKDKRINEAVERAVTNLKYGTVALNAYPGLSFGYGTPPWGAHPGSTPKNIQSGSGFVHNTPMLEGIEKAVLRHPFTTFPKPAYFPSHKTVLPMMRRLTQLEENASFLKVPGVVVAAMQG